MKRSRGRTRVESVATIGMIMLVIAFVLMLWSSCVPVDAGDLCAAVRSGSLLQTGEDPVTFDIVVNRETVMRSVTAERIMTECEQKTTRDPNQNVSTAKGR